MSSRALVPARHRLMVVLAAGALVVSACGSDGDDDSAAGPLLVEQGAQAVDTSDLDLPPDEPIEATSGGASEGESGDDVDAVAGTTTLPQNEVTDEEKVDDLFTAMRTFNQCLEDEGQPFIGYDGSAPADDPRQQPAYLEALAKCAAVSQIQEAMASVDLGSEGLTPEEIEEQNRGRVRFIDCLKGRGWDPAPMEPDENGMLQITDLGPPEGESMLGSDDMDECRRTASNEADENADG